MRVNNMLRFILQYQSEFEPNKWQNYTEQFVMIRDARLRKTELMDSCDDIYKTRIVAATLVVDGDEA